MGHESYGCRPQCRGIGGGCFHDLPCLDAGVNDCLHAAGIAGQTLFKKAWRQRLLWTNKAIIKGDITMDLKQYEVWFVTGSQHLYGQKTLETVAEHSREIAAALGNSAHLPVSIVFKPVLTTPEAIRELCLEANSARNCVGLI